MSRILAIDHGTVRIGLALSDVLQCVANPLKTLPSTPQAAAAIAEIARQKSVERVIVGLPLHLNGSHGEAALRVQAWVETLRPLLPPSVDVELVDERLSSVEAEAALKRSGVTDARARREVVDQLAAVVILQEYLNHQHGAQGLLLPEGADAFPEEPSHEPRGRRRR